MPFKYIGAVNVKVRRGQLLHLWGLLPHFVSSAAVIVFDFRGETN